MPISVVIITKNEARHIAGCIASAWQVTDDVVVVDSGSNDGTQQLAADEGAAVLEMPWKGYGANRNAGAEKAAYDWVLSIDADERISAELALALKQLELNDAAQVYAFKRVNYFGSKAIRHGAWGKDLVVRLYNRRSAAWDLSLVHERIDADDRKPMLVQGVIEHLTVKNLDEFSNKSVQYALLSGQKYYLAGKKAGWLKGRLAPVFTFITQYIFRLGMLDGKEGWWIAKTNAHYTFLKYAKLQELNRNRAEPG